jgi:hypothetical protein
LGNFNLDEYYKPYAPKLEIFDKDGNIIFEYDSFASSNPINLVTLECDSAVGTTGTWSAIIQDYERNIDRRVLGIGNRIKIYKGQDPQHYARIFSGVCRYDEDVRNKGGSLHYLLQGYGSQYITNERIVNFAKSAPQKVNLTSTGSYIWDSSMQANNVIASLISDPRSFPTGNPTIVESGDFDLSGISHRVDNFLPAVYLPYQDGNQAIDSLTSLIGAEWGVDCDDRFYLRFPESSADADTIIIKTTPDYETDNPQHTSYMVSGEQRYGRSMKREDGFANRLFALTASRQVVSASSSPAGGSETLHDKGIAQRVVPGTNKFRDLSLSLSKVGAPDVFSDPYIHGSIFTDLNDSPNHHGQVGAFDIDITTIPQGQASTVYQFNVAYADRATIIPNGKYWVVLHQLTALNDQNNTIRWYHNNDFETPNQYSAMKSPGTVYDDSNEEIGWMVSDSGPTYSYAAFSQVSHVAIAWDHPSIDRWGLVDGFVNNTSISDFDTMTRYLYSILQFSAKPKLQYSLTNVTFPLSWQIIPGQLVQLIDNVSGLTDAKKRMAEVMSVRYEWAPAGGETSACGINTCSIGLLGYYDFLKEEPTGPLSFRACG